METPVILLLMLFFLVMEGFFSGSEIGVISTDKLKLRHKAANGSKGAKIAIDMLKNPEWLLSTTLVGTNIAIVTNSTLATVLAVRYLGAEYSWIAIVILAPFIWLFGEIIPKSIFQQNADKITPKSIFVLKACSYIFFPILIIFTSLTKLLTKLVGGDSKESPFTLKEEIDHILRSDIQGDIRQDEKIMIRRMFKFPGAQVRDVIVPLIDVDSIPDTVTCGDAVDMANKHKHPRIPVHSERVDMIVGVVNTLDIIGDDFDKSIKDYITPVKYVPEAKELEELLIEFRNEGERLAIVVDEFGGAQGIVTLEDILEFIVGDIQDEYDINENDKKLYKRLSNTTIQINPRIDLVSLKEELNINIPDGEYETLSGFILDRVKSIPRLGQQIDYNGYRITIKEASSNVIDSVVLEFV